MSVTSDEEFLREFGFGDEADTILEEFGFGEEPGAPGGPTPTPGAPAPGGPAPTRGPLLQPPQLEPATEPEETLAAISRRVHRPGLDAAFEGMRDIVHNGLKFLSVGFESLVTPYDLYTSALILGDTPEKLKQRARRSVTAYAVFNEAHDDPEMGTIDWLLGTGEISPGAERPPEIPGMLEAFDNSTIPMGDFVRVALASAAQAAPLLAVPGVGIPAAGTMFGGQYLALLTSGADVARQTGRPFAEITLGEASRNIAHRVFEQIHKIENPYVEVPTEAIATALMIVPATVSEIIGPEILGVEALARLRKGRELGKLRAAGEAARKPPEPPPAPPPPVPRPAAPIEPGPMIGLPPGISPIGEQIEFPLGMRASQQIDLFQNFKPSPLTDTGKSLSLETYAPDAAESLTRIDQVRAMMGEPPLAEAFEGPSPLEELAELTGDPALKAMLGKHRALGEIVSVPRKEVLEGTAAAHEAIIKRGKGEIRRQTAAEALGIQLPVERDLFNQMTQAEQLELLTLSRAMSKFEEAGDFAPMMSLAEMQNNLLQRVDERLALEMGEGPPTGQIPGGGMGEEPLPPATVGAMRSRESVQARLMVLRERFLRAEKLIREGEEPLYHYRDPRGFAEILRDNGIMVEERPSSGLFGNLPELEFPPFSRQDLAMQRRRPGETGRTRAGHVGIRFVTTRQELGRKGVKIEPIIGQEVAGAQVPLEAILKIEIDPSMLKTMNQEELQFLIQQAEDRGIPTVIKPLFLQTGVQEFRPFAPTPGAAQLFPPMKPGAPF